MAKTLTQLVTRVETRLSMVAGVGVQFYSEDAIEEFIQTTFNTLFDKAFWPRFTTHASTYTLDGTNGIVTTDLTTLIKRFEDIRHIFPDNSNTALTELPSTINASTIDGTSPVHFSSNPDVSRIFTIWPKASTGDIQVTYRTKPDDFTSTDEIDFDEDSLVLGASWEYLKDDGTNPEATASMLALFEQRAEQILNSLGSHPVSLDPVTTDPRSFEFTVLAT